eukprot:703763-Pleurochrysis_carterae.AAC.3
MSSGALSPLGRRRRRARAPRCVTRPPTCERGLNRNARARNRAVVQWRPQWNFARRSDALDGTVPHPAAHCCTVQPGVERYQGASQCSTAWHRAAV